MKKIFLLLILTSGTATVFAQLNYDKLKIADDYFRRQDYSSAAIYYEQCLQSGKRKDKKTGYNPYAVETAARSSSKSITRERIVYNLAECYRLLNYPAKAESYYKEALGFDKDQFPLAGYYYAATLRALSKFEEAEKEFQAFLDTYKNDDTYSTSAKREILNLDFIQSQLKKDISLYTIVKQVNEMGSAGSNYAPVWINSNTVLFTSSRADSAASKYRIHTNRLYVATYENETTTGVASFPLAQDKDVHQGTAALSEDGAELYFTRWSVKDGKKNAAIYASRKSSDKWSEPVILDSMVNVGGYSSQQPFVMPGGKLLFASDRPGGMGGFDLWIADLSAGGTPVNLGEVINTSFDEQAAYYHVPSGKLVFSTNGRVGMGGFDFFESKGKPGAWSEPVNLGYPVNSVKDDIYFVSRGSEKNMLEDVLISSDRSAECCLELFSVKKKKIIKQIKGLVVDCETRQPLPGATVRFFNMPDGSNAFDNTAGVDGAYSFTLDEYKPLKAEVVLEGYENATLLFNAPDDESSHILNNPAICLVKIKVPVVGEVIVMDNIYYEFDKYKLKPESYAALDKIVHLMKTHPALTIEIGSHTDGIGDDVYNETLSQLRAQSCVDYLVAKGVDTNRLAAKGYGEKVPVAPNKNANGSDNAEGRKQNRRTEFKVLTN